MKFRVVAVSNRVASPQEGHATGGLAVGVLAALREHGGIWFGWNGKTTPGEPQDADLHHAGNLTYATINLNRKEFDAYYNGFSNATLWPLFHCLLEFFRYRREEYDAYRRINAVFARKLLPLLRPNDVIWVHDYHLIPLAAELRRAGVTQPIGFFLHIPFPGYDMLRALPDHGRLLDWLCQYDVVGFQTQRDLHSFQECVTQVSSRTKLLANRRIQTRERTLTADVFPIGIDVEYCAQQASEGSSEPAIRRLKESLRERRLLVGVDRLDYSKGLAQRFLAYERMLERYPDNARQVVLMQIAPPTRTGVRTYQEIRKELETIAGHINGRFADVDWVPARYIHKAYDRGLLMAILRTAQVGLVTALRDGMNLVAKEFVAAQDPEDPGVLVLSRLAGASWELDQAVLVDPYDTDSLAEGMQRALHMPLPERRKRHAAMMDVLRRNDINSWRVRFVQALEEAQT